MHLKVKIQENIWIKPGGKLGT